MLDERNLSPIHYKRVNAKTGKEVENSHIVKGYAYEKNQYVIMNDEDFEKANPKATQTIDIEDFVQLKDIDLLLFEKPYYLAPEKSGEKGYFLLREALMKSKKVAVAKVVMHTKQHLCCIFARGEYLILEIMRFSHQIKASEKVDYLKGAKTKSKFSDRELKMAEQLIEGMTSKWKPEKYTDTYYDDLMTRIHAKIKAGKGKKIERPEEKTEKSVKITGSKTEDLMALLKKSLETKKPKRAAHSRSLH